MLPDSRSLARASDHPQPALFRLDAEELCKATITDFSGSTSSTSNYSAFLNLCYPRDYDTVPRLWFWLFHFVWLFPWSVYLPAVSQAFFQAY